MSSNVTKVFPLLKTEVARMFTIAAEIKQAQNDRARQAALTMSEQARKRHLAAMAAQALR